MLLKGRVCVVTGDASRRGLGLATARQFAEHGAGHLGLACDVTHKHAC